MSSKHPLRTETRSEVAPDVATTFGMIPTAPAGNQDQEPQPRTAKTDAERSAELVRIAAIGSPFALRKDKLTGKVLEAEPHERSVKWWGLQKKLPHWLVEAMAAQRYPNQELTEREAEELALATANLPLGAQKGKA